LPQPLASHGILHILLVTSALGVQDADEEEQGFDADEVQRQANERLQEDGALLSVWGTRLNLSLQPAVVYGKGAGNV
jgi:hypothetical protein